VKVFDARGKQRDIESLVTDISAARAVFIGELGLFLVLARVAHQGSRLSAVRWARDHAVAEVLGPDAFDEEDLYGALASISTLPVRI